VKLTLATKSGSDLTFKGKTQDILCNNYYYLITFRTFMISRFSCHGLQPR